MLFRVRRGTSPSTPGDYTKVAGGLRPPHFSAPSCIPPNCCPGPCPPLRGQAALLAPGTSHRAAPAPWSRHMWLDAWLATQLPAWLSGCWACCGPPTPFRTFPSCTCRPQWTLAATGTPAGRADEAGAQAGKSGALTSQMVGTSLLRVAWGCPQAHLSLWEAAGGQAGAISVSAQTHGGGSGLCQARGSLGTEGRKPNSEGAQWPASHTSPLRCRPENQTLRRRRGGEGPTSPARPGAGRPRPGGRTRSRALPACPRLAEQRTSLPSRGFRQPRREC